MALVTDPDAVFSVPSVNKPAYLTPITDPTFGTTITRIVGNSGDTITFSHGGSGVWGTDVRHHYSTDQPWNADGTLLALQNSGGSGTPSQVLLDGKNYTPAYNKCAGYSIGDDRWLEDRPHVRMNVNGTSLEWYDVIACSQLRSWTLPISHSNDLEMGPSRAGRFIALGSSTEAFVVDMDPQPPFDSYEDGNRRIGATRNITDCGFACTPDSINISPSGKYVLVRYSGDFQRVFDVNPSTLELSVHQYAANTPECSSHDPANGFIFDIGHGDMTYSLDEEVTVGQFRDWCPATVNGVALGQLQKVRLIDGAVTNLVTPTNSAQNYHASARNFDRPGWMYASFWPSTDARFNDEIIAVSTDGTQRVERYAHDHTDTDTTDCDSGYRCESHPVASPDGSRVLFASSWSLQGNGSTTNPQAYVMTVPAESPLPVLDIAATSATKNEGNTGSTPFTFTVSRSGDLISPSSALYAVTGSGGNPASATDFVGGVLPNGTVSFAASDPSEVITINVAGDTSVESNEGFTVTLSDPTNATLGTDTATGTINNDDSSGTTWEGRTLASAEDAEQKTSSGQMTLNSSDLELTNDSGNIQAVGMRFTNITIPQGHTISNAYIQFTAKETQSDATTLTIKAQAADDPATFTTTAYNITSRTLGTASASWSPVAWGSVDEAGTKQRTPNIANVIQGVISRSGWSSGNHLVIVITGSGHRTPYAYDGSSTKAPLLHIEYQ